MSLTENGMLAAAIAKDKNGNDVVGLWDTQTGAQIAPLSTLHRVVIRSVALSARGTFAAACSDDWTIHIWDLDRRTCRVVVTPGLTSVAKSQEPSPDTFGRVIFPIRSRWSPDRTSSECLFSTGPAGQLYCWEPNEGRLISSKHSHTAPITCLAVDGPQSLATGSADSTVCIWQQISLDTCPPSGSKPSHDDLIGDDGYWARNETCECISVSHVIPPLTSYVV